jgi:hypothetical protein
MLSACVAKQVTTMIFSILSSNSTEMCCLILPALSMKNVGVDIMF